MEKNDLQLKQDIEAELRWDPKINAAQIGVSVNKGAVSLVGTVDTYAEKWATEDAIKRVAGVRSVAEDLTVKLLSPRRHSDSDIAAAALSALKWDVWIPKGVSARVEQGAVTLEGTVDWNYQRDSAERAVRYLAGVVSVSNQVTLKSRGTAGEVKDKVLAALQRQARKDTNNIGVATSGGTVTLSGEASSWRVIDDAEDAAWAAPGVTQVIDNVLMTGY